MKFIEPRKASSILAVACVAALAVYSSPALADEPTRPDFPVVVPQPEPVAPAPVAPPPAVEPEKCSFHYGIGLGAGYRPDYEGSNDYKPFPIGFARVWWDEGYEIKLAGTESSGSAVRLSSNVIPNSDFEFGPVVQYRLPRDEVHSGRVDTLDEPDEAWEVGGQVAYTPGPWELALTYTYDVSGQYSGSLVELVAGWHDQLTDLFDLGISTASTWASNDYMREYFGVTAAEAAGVNLDAYDADAAFKDVGGRIRLGFGGEEWDGWKIFAIGSYFRMLGDAADSPIVDDAGSKDQFFGGLGVAYSR